MTYQLEIDKTIFKSYKIYRILPNGLKQLWVTFMTKKQAEQFLNGK